MRIGDLAEATGTAVATIRFYEREGLLPQAPRSEGNYRLYGPEYVERLAFVRHCRSLDMTLDEIRVLLRFQHNPHADCGEVNVLLDEHIDHVETRIGELRVLERQLKALRERCVGVHAVEHCGILTELAQAAASLNAPTKVPSRQGSGTHGRGPRKSG
jgi:Cd(II)/Pb(II)-responsive transcriptional regulator